MSDRSSVIVIRDNRVLLMRRLKYGADYYVIPGGGIDLGETPEQAAIRELKEEANLDVVLEEKFHEQTTYDRYVHYYISYTYTGKVMLGGEEKVLHNDPTLDDYYKLEWIPFERIGRINLFPFSIQKKILNDMIGQLMLL